MMSNLGSDSYFPSSENNPFLANEVQCAVMAREEDSCPSSLDDVDEFEMDESKPLDDYMRLRNKNEFVYDPENGGGRRRRTKKVSRIEILNLSNTA